MGESFLVEGDFDVEELKVATDVDTFDEVSPFPQDEAPPPSPDDRPPSTEGPAHAAGNAPAPAHMTTLFLHSEGVNVIVTTPPTGTGCHMCVISESLF